MTGRRLIIRCIREMEKTTRRQEIKWSEDTAKTWLTSSFKVDSRGKLTEVLARLTREQSEQFVHELQERAARQ